MAVNALKKLSGSTSDKIRYISYVYNSMEREIEGERIVERNEEMEGKEIGKPAGTTFIVSRKHGCLPAHCMRYFSLLPTVFKEMVFNGKRYFTD